jgi:beta-mannosidase
MLVQALIYSIIVLSNTAQGKQFVNQLSSNWTLANRNGSIVLNNLSVPIGVHNALTDAKLTQNLLYGYNDVNLRWILYDDWTFTNYFQIDDNLNDNFVYLLEFLEIDTIASIYLNDKFIQFTNNQFIKYTTDDLYSHLMNGQNKLVIKLQSPVLYAKDLSVLYPYRVPPECPLDVQKGECHINFLRKQQCSFSWDWGMYEV